MHQSDMNATFITTWNDWTKAIIDRALATQYTPASLKEAMRDIRKEVNSHIDDIHGESTTILLSCMLYTILIYLHVMKGWSHQQLSEF